MKRFLLLISLASASAFAATAPDSIAGRVYHQFGGIAALRAKWEMIVNFGADGRYSVLKYARGSFVNNPAIALATPPNDGTYVYTQGQSIATISLQDPTGTLFDEPSNGKTTALTIALTFSDASVGEWDSNGGHGGFYFTDPGAPRPGPVINLSLRGNVGGTRTAIAGFVVPGPAYNIQRSVDLLIRAVGPSLEQFNVGGLWADPNFTLVVHPSDSIAYYGDWEQTADSTNNAIRKIANQVGAFPLTPGSKDAVAVVRVMPGAYTLVCNPPPGDAGGEVLIEVYALP